MKNILFLLAMIPSTVFGCGTYGATLTQYYGNTTVQKTGTMWGYSDTSGVTKFMLDGVVYQIQDRYITFYIINPSNCTFQIWYDADEIFDDGFETR